MPPRITWDDVRADLAALEGVIYSPLDEALEAIKGLIGGDASPEGVKYFIEMIARMSDQFGERIQKPGGTEKKKALTEVLEEAQIKFRQDKWHVKENVNAEKYFNFVMNVIQKEVDEPKLSIKLPVVLLVMNQQAAEQLNSGKIAVEMPKNYLDEFKKLTDLLSPDWLKRYGKTPVDWKPFDALGESIDDLMTTIFDEVRSKLDYHKLIIPDFVDVRTLNVDRKRLNTLRGNGCFVINDVISLWHPAIQLTYRASLLEAFPSTMVYRIAPIDQALRVSHPLITYVEKYEDLEFYKRIKDRDLNCRNFWESEEFSSFVVNYAPKLIPTEDKETSVVTRNIVGKRTR